PAQLFFKAKESVVFGDAVRAGGRTGLDLTGTDGHRQIGNEGVLGFTGAMGDDRVVTVFGRHLDGPDGFGKASNLVYLNEDGVGDAAVDAVLKPGRIR